MVFSYVDRGVRGGTLVTEGPIRVHRRVADVVALIKCGEDSGFLGWMDGVRTLRRNVYGDDMKVVPEGVVGRVLEDPSLQALGDALGSVQGK